MHGQRCNARPPARPRLVVDRSLGQFYDQPVRSIGHAGHKNASDSSESRRLRDAWNGIRNPPGIQEACVRLLIAIPVFNERRYVESVLTEVKRYADEVLC